MSNTVNRYIWLVSTLLRFKRLTLAEISSKWQSSSLNESGKALSHRTFFDHKREAEYTFDININCDASDGYSYYIEDPSTIYKDQARQWMLNSFNVSYLVSEGRALRDRIILEDIPGGTEYLSTLIEAIRENKELELDYQPFYKDESAVYHVRPYCMRVHRQRWYILGYCLEENGLRNFSLDRTKGMVKTNTVFEFPENFSGEEHYRGSIGIWVNDKVKPETVVLRAYGQKRLYLRSLPLHSSQEEVATTEAYSDFRYTLRVTDELVRTLLAEGHDLEVVQPVSLRKKMMEETREIAKRNFCLSSAGYTVHRIRAFDELREYLGYTEWCILYSEDAYEEYLEHGRNKLFILVREDMEHVDANPGVLSPRDDYGFSLMAVYVGPDGRLVNVTSRWNSAQEDGMFASEEELKGLLGEKFELLMK
jgi:hypothetical protein